MIQVKKVEKDMETENNIAYNIIEERVQKDDVTGEDVVFNKITERVTKPMLLQRKERLESDLARINEILANIDQIVEDEPVDVVGQ